MITDWIVNALAPAFARLERKRNEVSEVKLGRDRSRDEVLHDCDTVRLSIIHVSNGTLLRMDTHRHEDHYNTVPSVRRTPNVVIIKDGETIQDAVVRMLAIAQLERS